MLRAPNSQITTRPAQGKVCTYTSTGQITCNPAATRRLKEGFYGEYIGAVTSASASALSLLGQASGVGFESDTTLTDAEALARTKADADASYHAHLVARATAEAAAKVLANQQAEDAEAQALVQAQTDASNLGKELARTQQALSAAQAQIGSPGLTWYRYDQGYFSDSPSWFQGQTASANGITNGWSDLSQVTGVAATGYLPIAKVTAFSILVSGYFVAQSSGNHQFSLTTADASYMWIGPSALGAAASVNTLNACIRLSGLHPTSSSSVTVALVVGQAYPLLIMYGQRLNGLNLQFSFVPPGGTQTIDGTGYFFKSLPTGIRAAASIVTVGLSWYRYDQGYFRDSPTWFQGQTATSSGSTTGWTDLARTTGVTARSFLPIGLASQFSMLLSGYFVATTSGNHQFKLSSGDASYLWIGPSALGAAASVLVSGASINISGEHGNKGGKVNVMLVANQAYPLLIMYGRSGSGWNLQFSFISPGNAETIDGTGNLFTTLPAGIQVASAISTGGLTWYRYDQGYFSDSPTWFQGQTATATGVTSGWTDVSRSVGTAASSLLPIAQLNKFSILVSGYFVPTVSGSHQFTLSSSDASYLWVGPTAVGAAASVLVQNANISLSGLHGIESSSVSLTLVSGQSYPMLIMYGQSNDAGSMRFTFTPPGSTIMSDGTGYYYQTAPGQVAQQAPQSSGFTGRYIKISQPAVGYMNLSEVQVYSTSGGPNIALGKTATASSTLTASPASNLTDGSLSNYSSTSGSEAPWFQIDLGSVLPIFNVRLFNRTDCCQSRGNGVMVSVLDGSSNTIFTSNVLADRNGLNVYTDDRTKDSAAYSIYDINPPIASVVPQVSTVMTARYIKLYQPTVGCLNIAEVQVYSTVGGPNIATGAVATQSSVYAQSFPASNLTDGNMTNYAHSSCNDAAWFLIDLGSMQVISNIRIYNRTDCCQGRINGLLVSLLDGNQNVVFTADKITDRNGSSVYAGPNASAYLIFNINPPSTAVVPDLTMYARYIKLFQPTVGCLNIAEVQVYSTVGGPNIATGAVATQSSVYAQSFPASNLTDGNMTNYAHSSCNDAAWFLIDLGSMQAISNIRIYNRTDCCQGRINGLLVSLLDGNQNVVFAADKITDRNGNSVYGGSDSTAYLIVNINPPVTTVVPQA